MFANHFHHMGLELFESNISIIVCIYTLKNLFEKVVSNIYMVRLKAFISSREALSDFIYFYGSVTIEVQKFESNS